MGFHFSSSFDSNFNTHRALHAVLKHINILVLNVENLFRIYIF